MLYGFLWFMHVVVVIALIGVILVQRGRSGGLVEALGGVESIFGTKTSQMLVRTTVGLAIAFFTTSVSLAYISKERSKSVMEKYQDQTQASGAAMNAPAPIVDAPVAANANP